MNNHSICVKHFSKNGKLNKTYSPLQNLIKNGVITPFVTKKITYDLTNSLNIDIQTSYDDSVNLILTNNDEIPRIINSQFRVKENFTYEYLVRNQGSVTNIYNEDYINRTSDLFLKSINWPIIDLLDVKNEGTLMGGNYTFYIKYCDEDFNETEIISESSIITIFNGTNPLFICGTIMDERTSKNIELKISNLDSSFNKFNLYFSRETCDLNGINITKYYKISKPYAYASNSENIIINGYENLEEISFDELFVNYNYFVSAKTQAIVQNMLFLGNVKVSQRDYKELQQLSYKISTTLKQKDNSIGYVDTNYNYKYNVYNIEYYEPRHIYYHLGYWPNEFYKLGICYILADGSTTNVFNLYGGKLTKDKPHTWDDPNINYLEINTILDDDLNNTGGIFKLPNISVIDHNNQQVKPLYFEFSFTEELLDQLKKHNVIGYFFVRTNRVPISLFQGLSVGVDQLSGIPLPYVKYGDLNYYVAESFLNGYNEDEDPGNPDTYDSEKENSDSRRLSNKINLHLRKIDFTPYSGLISLDPLVSSQLKSLLSWNKFNIEKEYTCTTSSNPYSRLCQVTSYNFPDKYSLNTELVYIEENISKFYLNGKEFSTKAGNAETSNEFAYLNDKDYEYNADNLIRGIYTSFIGCNATLDPSSIYTVKLDINDEKNWLNSLLNNNDSYHSITNRYSIENTYNNLNITAYRGDCFTNTITIRLNRNFIDPSFPANNKLVDENTWRSHYCGDLKMKTIKNVESDDSNYKYSWANINVGDLNTVQLGQWITFKCLSNYNLGLRSIDTRDTNLMTSLGSVGGSFYPISGLNVESSGKMPESKLLNEGYSKTLSKKAYYKWESLPYENWNFENRIAFSNVASTKMFTNGFRVFQGLSYQDVDKQFGQIVKLFPYAQNLLCVFEHGLAIIPINEKALLSTQEGQSIHLYGAGVLQEQVSVISPDYGSSWPDSLIRTPDAYYGVDTHAKKIWKFNNAEGFQCISDFKIQSFLNENLNIDINELYYFGATNIKTHYNNLKGDVIFTFYNNEKSYSICYNERMKIWTCKYSWIPLISANSNNHFYSFDQNIINKYTQILKQSTKKSGIICKKPIYNESGIKLNYSGSLLNNIELKIKSAKLEFSENIYYVDDNFKLIINDNDISGIYFNNITQFGEKSIGILNDKYNKKFIFEEKPLFYDDDKNEWFIITDIDKDGKWTLQELINDYSAWQNMSLREYKTYQESNPNFEISAIPIIIEEISEEYTFSDNKFYIIYLIKNNNDYILYTPDIDSNITLELQAIYNNETLEEYSLTIGNKFNQSIQLYEHSNDSPICNWYDKQYPFEYEFVVNQPAGFHKIFNNLMIISNNVEPDSLEVEIVGDVYDFKKEFISQNENIKYKFPVISITENKTYQTKLILDKITDEHRLLMHQDCLNIKDLGRRLGNISYIEGKWYIVLQPIYYEDKTLKTTRLRDKWAKIRIKYFGDKLAIITAIQTLMNISYV